MKLRFIPFTCLAFLYAATASGALPEIPDNDAGASLWKSKRRQAIESVLSGEAGLRIPQLGEMLRQLTTLRYRSSPEKDEIVGLLRQSLVSIPGHAEYYRDRLLNAQEEMKRTYGNPTLYGPAVSEYDKAQMYGFQTLPHLPSPETVRVYGEMLFNDWAPPGNEDAIASEKLPLLSNRATGGLSRLPIENKPFRETLSLANLPDAREAWRQWYQEIKDGKRTFRFEGDPTEYDLDGPAPKQKLERIALADRRDTERAHGRERGGTTANESAREMTEADRGLPVAVSIAAAALLFVSVTWYVARRRKHG